MRKASLLLVVFAAFFAGACTPSLDPEVTSSGGTSLNASWEYTILTFRQADAQYAQTRLNEMGQDRWECFYIDKSIQGIHYLFKRPEQE